MDGSCSLFGLRLVTHSTMQEALIWWSSQKRVLRSIPQLLLWLVWKWRNSLVFQDEKENKKPVLDKIISTHSSLPFKMTCHKNKNSKEQCSLQMGFLQDLFDGASQQGIFSCGIHIEMNEEWQIFIYWNGGKGKNNKVEAMALASLLHFGTCLNIQNLHIFGDSKIIIEHVKRKLFIKFPMLLGWMNRINALWNRKKDYCINHVDRIQNQKADSLLKMGLTSQRGIWKMEIQMGPVTNQIKDFSLSGT